MGSWGGSRPGAGRPKKALALVGGTDVEAEEKPATVPAEPKGKGSFMPSVDAIAEVIAASNAHARRQGRRPELNPFRLPDFPRGALPPEKLRMAMDEAGTGWGSAQWANGYLDNVASEGLLFPGYAYLSELAQRPEYRTFADIISTEMTRKWIKQTSVGAAEGNETKEAKEKKEADAAHAAEDAAAINPGAEQAPPTKKKPPPSDKSENRTAERIKELVQFMDDLRVRDRYALMASNDSFFGRSHLFHDLGGQSDEEVKTPLAIDGKILKGKIGGKLKLRRLQPVEPMWCYPTTYNASNPLAPDWYNPQVWYVLGKEIHQSRIARFVGRPVPDMLKPSYAFGGLSMTQLAKPYVDIWLQTRASVGQLIHAFSVMVLMTDMQSLLQPNNAESLLTRVALFNAFRDNQGAFVLNKATEDFKNVSAPLGGLHELQAQSQEHMMSVARIPAVKFTGIQPAGLSTTSEGELRAFYDSIRAFQNFLFRPNLNFTIDLAQISLWGQTDPDIVYDFEPLWDQTEKEKGEKRKADAEVGKIHIETGAISPEEERRRIIDDPESPYQGLDPDDVPELAEEEEEGLEPEGGRPDPKAKGEPEGGGGAGDGDPFSRSTSYSDDADELFGGDAWTESEHPRGQPGNAGQFGSGGKGGTSSSKPSGGASPGGGGGKERQKFQAPQYGLTPTPKTAHQHEPDDGSAYFKANWHKSGSVGGHSQPTQKQIDDYTNAYLEQAKPESSSVLLNPKALKRVGEKMGSNPGGTFETSTGERFYVKKGQSKEHVDNELAAADLYALAGAPTLDYRPVEGGGFIATKLAKLDKSHATKFSPSEIAKAREDFVAHAWLGNWDAVGTGSDNMGTIGGVPTALDLGGAMLFRAQGGPKGAAFGPKVGELETMRNPKMSPDAAKVFGSMSTADMKLSATKVTSISDEAIRQVIAQRDMPESVADTLIARKGDIAKRFGLATDELASDTSREPEHVAEIHYDGDFNMAGLLRHMHALGGMGASRDIVAIDGDDKPVRFGWDGDGADRIWIATIDGKDALTQQAGDEFKESDHPRAPDGKFGSGGGSSEGESGGESEEPEKKELEPEKKEEAAAKSEGKFKTKKEQIGHMLTEGATMAEMLAAVGWPTMSVPAQAASLGMKLTTTKEGGVTKYKGTPMTTAELQELKEKIAAAKALKATKGKDAPETIAAAKEAVGAAVGKSFEEWKESQKAEPAPEPAKPSETAAALLAAQKQNEALKKQYPKAAAKLEPAPAPEPAKPALPAPTDAELAKAKKTAPLQTQYLGIGDVPKTSAVEAAMKEFNDKYSGKEMTSQPALIQKVNDFKALQTKVTGMLSAEKQKAIAAQKEAAAAAQKKAAEEAEKYKAEQIKKETEAKKSHDKIKAELGITDSEAKGFESMISMLGASSLDSAVKMFKGMEASAKATGYSELSGFENALIQFYTGPGSGSINKNLRDGAVTEGQFVYMKHLNRGIDKLPKFTGLTKRFLDLKPDDKAKYKVGQVVEQHNFSSSRPTGHWPGDSVFHITAIGKRAASVQKLSSHPGENEVLFKSGTFMRVDKVEQGGGKFNVHMTEMSYDD